MSQKDIQLYLIRCYRKVCCTMQKTLRFGCIHTKCPRDMRSGVREKSEKSEKSERGSKCSPEVGCRQPP